MLFEGSPYLVQLAHPRNMGFLYILLLVVVAQAFEGFESIKLYTEDPDSPEEYREKTYDLHSFPFQDEDIKIKLNHAVDIILEKAREAFTNDGQLVIPLRDINKPFGHGLLAGHFQASGGYFKNPASLKRTGDVAIAKEGNSVSLQVALGLVDAEAGYDSYKLDLLNIHQNGKVHVQIVDNSLSMKVSLTYAPECSFKLDYVLFDRLAGVKMEITGLGNFQGLFDNLSKWLIDNFQGNLKTIVNKVLYDKLELIMKKNKICNLIPH